MIRFIVCVLVAVAAWLGAYVLEGGNPTALLGFSAFLITFFVPLFGVLAVWPWKAWLRAWSHAFGKTIDPAEGKVSVAIWKFSEFACYLAGILGWLTGAILILLSVENIDLYRFAHANAAGLVSPLYGVLFGLVSRILRARVESLMTP